MESIIESKEKKPSIEIPLQKDYVGRLIKALRRMSNYSQEKLGKLIGVQKAQVSKLEKGDKNITLSTLLKIFSALKSKVSFKLQLKSKQDLKIFNEYISNEEDKIKKNEEAKAS